MFSAFSSLRPGAILTGAAQAGLAVFAGFAMTSCSSAPKAEVVVSVKDQRMGVYADGHLVKQYVVSTSKFGVGDRPGSCCTPLGKHEVIAKIGHGLPAGAVLKSRSWNGEVLKPNAPGRDPVVSRILWLRGMERTNRNAMGRYIYIHGTTEENYLGRPASYGCIRMGMKDVVEVFNEVGIGAKVIVTKSGLPHVKKAAEPAPAPEALVASATPSTTTPSPAAAAAAAAAGPANTSGSAIPFNLTTTSDSAPHGKKSKSASKSEASADSHSHARTVVKGKAHKDTTKASKSVTVIKGKQLVAMTDKAKS